MGKIVNVTCDGCEADLTVKTNSVDYRLVLASENKPGHGAGFYTAMMKYPAVSRAYYFCDLRCLDHWRGREHHKGNLWKMWWADWKEKNGTKHEDGRIFSYPEPPREMTEERAAEFEDAALVAFPMHKP